MIVAAAIWIASVIAYLAGFIVTGRAFYIRKRPYTEPVACDSRDLHSRYSHRSWCYKRPGTLITSDREALGWAVLASTVWPALAPWLALCAVKGPVVRFGFRVIASSRPLPEETAARRSKDLRAVREEHR